MDPNNNQASNQQVNGQAVNNMQQQPVQASQNPVAQATPQQPAVQYQNPKGNSHKSILLLIILLIMVLGLAGYLVFANMNPAVPQNVPVPTVVAPPPTATPTPTVSEDDFTIEDPEIDIKVMDDAAATL